MSTQRSRAGKADDRLVLMQGTLDVLILRTLLFGSEHGQGIARAIQQTSEGELLVDHGALYPALQRLEEKELISAAWGTSANNRRARFYTLTKAGRAHLARQSSRWRRLAAAMARVLGPEPELGS
jgi:transcriptional regulator